MFSVEAVVFVINRFRFLSSKERQLRELKEKIKKASAASDPNLDSLKKSLNEMEKSAEEAKKKAEALEKEEKVGL